MEISPDLFSPDQKAFEAALVTFHSQLDRKFSDSIAAINTLATKGTLGASEIARRARLLIGQASLSEPEADELIKAAAQWQGGIKLAIQTVLSPAQRQRIYASKDEQLSQPVTGTVVASAKPAVATVLDLGASSVDEPDNKAEDDFRTVLLLGSAEAHESNISFLKAKDFTPSRVDSLTSLDSSLGGAICGIVIDGTWWTQIPDSEHENCLRRLLSFSNFIWLKIDDTSLRREVVAGFDALCRSSRFRDPAINEVGFPSLSKLGEVDIQRLSTAAMHLAAAGRIRFHPSEINEAEATVLLGAIHKRVSIKPGLTPVQIERVDTTVVHGGMSLAKIVILKPNDAGAPFVAKISSQEYLRDEMLRFHTYIEAWQGQLRPELYLHHDVAVIFFALIDAADAKTRPAPTLEDRVISLWNNERSGLVKDAAKLEDLQEAISKAIEKLVGLNSQPFPKHSVKNVCWVKFEPMIELKKNNVEFSLKDEGKPINIIGVLEGALTQVEKLNGRAICHGDVHLRNILVRLDREPLFIDFANSGPGHPAFDLVRLEAALLYAHVRMAEGEDEMVECFHSLFSKDWNFEELKRSHPALLSSKPSCLAVHASIETRKAALKVLKIYGGTEKDYFCLKLIVACQSLTIRGFQEGAARAGIRAICRILKTI